MQKHKWYNEIVAWASGAEIEAKHTLGNDTSEWFLNSNPLWNDDNWEYRIKPQPKEPQYLYVYDHGGSGFSWQSGKIPGWNNIYIGKIKLEVDDDTNPA